MYHRHVRPLTDDERAELERMTQQEVGRVAERAPVEPSFRDVLEAVVERRLSLPDFLAAHTRGDLDRVRTALAGPPLASAIDEFVGAHSPGRGAGSA